MSAYYNEHDKHAAAWLRELIKRGLIAAGDVDERSICDVRANDLRGFTQCHFFAGIGGWSLALRFAGWDDDKPAWSGSCPCQPFSVAGKGKGVEDERHLWPVFAELIRECRPPVVFGEQVASAAGREWLAGVFADLEGMAYNRAGADLCAAGVGAPHIRQRLFWLAHAESRGLGIDGSASRQAGHTDECGAVDGLADMHGNGCDQRRVGESATGSNGVVGDCASGRLDIADCVGSAARISGQDARHEGLAGVANDAGDQANSRERERERETVWLVHAKQSRLEGYAGHEHDRNQSRWIVADSARSASEAGHVSAWSRCNLIPCADGKTRRAEPESFPLAHGLPGRVGLLRGYGNAICPQIAAEFVAAYLELK